MKPWYQSKTIWFNIVMTFLDIIAVFETSPLVTAEMKASIVLAHSIGNVILRVWFSDTTLRIR